ncbi:MAG: type IV pilus assembly protein PilM [Planctomycetota bacterium]|nr:MAG: type IV pilus assembly protein PilM [Planctomycetota bacterium]
MFGKQNRVVGLDIGSSEIKALEMQKFGDGYAITGFASTRVHSPDETRAAIQEVIATGGFRTRRVVTAVSGRSVIVRYVNMPRMAPDQLRSAVRYEADKYIPFEVEDVVLDCQVLEPETAPTEGEQPEMKVLLVAVKKSLIEEHVALLSDCNLTPAVIDVDAFALGNAFELHVTASHREREFEDRVVALIDIGANKTNINIVRGGNSYFTREVYLAGNDFTEAIARRLGIDEEEAEALKCEPRDRVGEVEECILPTLDDLGNEIQLSFDYFENQFEREVEEVYVSGGSAKLPGLARTFEASFDRPIIFWDPLENLPIRSDRIDEKAMLARSNQLAVVVGLASRVRGKLT